MIPMRPFHAWSSIGWPSRVFSTVPISTVKQERKRIILHWFRLGDLRLLDNQALIESVRFSRSYRKERRSYDSALLIPFFCFDSQIFGAHSRWGTLKCSPKRAKFIVESVTDLRDQLQAHLQLPLLVAHGNPAEIFKQLLLEIQSNDSTCAGEELPNVQIVCQDEPFHEEQKTVDAVSAVLRQYAKHHDDTPVTVTVVWGSYLHTGRGMSYPNTKAGMPALLSTFCADVQKKYKLKALLPVPEADFAPLPSFIHDHPMAGFMPTLRELGYSDEQVSSAEPHPSGVMMFRGGETAALARLNAIVTDKFLLEEYCDTRNGLVGASYSTKLSPWLAHGCLSPRTVALEVKVFVKANRKLKATFVYTASLVHRDYCRIYAARYGKAIFQRTGPKLNKKPKSNKKRVTRSVDTETTPRDTNALFQAWQNGQTGFPFIDACMRELQATGYLSSRGRVNVASFLIFDLGVDWRRGADWFESQLMDYDVSLNWVNWLMSTGLTIELAVRINVVFEGLQYDPNRAFVRLWVPELRHLPDEFVHEPWNLTESQQVDYQMKLGVDYPFPILSNYPMPGESRAKRLARSTFKLTREQMRGFPTAMTP